MEIGVEGPSGAGMIRWEVAGRVVADTMDPLQDRFIEGTFRMADTFLGGPVDCPAMAGDACPGAAEAFRRVVWGLEANGYRFHEDSVAALFRDDPRPASGGGGGR